MPDHKSSRLLVLGGVKPIVQYTCSRPVGNIASPLPHRARTGQERGPMKYTRYILLVCLLSAALFLAAGGAWDAGSGDAAAPLADVQLVEVNTLSSTGRINAPRDDSRVPKLLADLVKDEKIVRIVYSDCTFTLVDGYPVWTWWLSGGMYYETDPDALRKRLEQRLEGSGFEARPKMPATVPNTTRFKWLESRFCRDEPGRQWRVEYSRLSNPVGNPPAVAVDNIACSIRGTEKVKTPTFSEVLAAAPDFVPPAKGNLPIPPSVLEAVQPLPVTGVQLSGPGTTWYGLTITTPLSSLKDFRLEERLDELLVAEKFEQKARQVPRGPRDPASPSRSYLARDELGANCLVELYKLDDAYHVNLRVYVGRPQ